MDALLRDRKAVGIRSSLGKSDIERPTLLGAESA
jgi:hypothetical protein